MELGAWWKGLNRQQKARYVAHGLVGAGCFVVGRKLKGPGAGVAAAALGVAAHEVLDVPVAMLLLSLGLI